MFAMMHVLLHEQRARATSTCRSCATARPRPTSSARTAGTCAIPPARKPLLWDASARRAVPFDTPGAVPALEGRFTRQRGRRGRRRTAIGGMHRDVDGRTGLLQAGRAHVRSYSPEWAAGICDVPAATHPPHRQRVSRSRTASARPIEIDGKRLPFRPVAVTLGKTVNNGWGAFDCCWARTLLAVLVGALEVPGGTLGTTVRINRPHEDRHQSVKPGEDGFMAQHAQSDRPKRTGWRSRPAATRTARWCRSSATAPWSQALGPDAPGLDVPATSRRKLACEPTLPGDLDSSTAPIRPSPSGTRATSPRRWRAFPFMVCFAYTLDETNYMADLLLPEATDLESLQLIRLGSTKFVEQFWRPRGLRAAPAGRRAAGRHARLHLDQHRARAAHRPAEGLQQRHQPRRGRACR